MSVHQLFVPVGMLVDTAGRSRPLDGAPGGGRSGQTETGAAGRKGNHSDSAAQPRLQAVAGKKCGGAPG